MNVESHRHQAVDHMLDLLFARAFLHDDYHCNSCSSFAKFSDDLWSDFSSDINHPARL